MIDLHTHSLLSDGELLPAELIQRAEHIGYTVLSITDHADISNMDWIIPRIIKVCKWYNGFKKIRVLPGIELTHIPPEAIPDMAQKARDLGAVIIVVHGETLAEPVAPGTNYAALKSDIDILAHPGILSDLEAETAFSRDICLEISTRRGHSLSNGHVAKTAKKTGAKLIINTDAHGPDDLVTQDQAFKIAQGAGIENTDFDTIVENSKKLVEKAIEKFMKGPNYED